MSPVVTDILDFQSTYKIFILQGAIQWLFMSNLDSILFLVFVKNNFSPFSQMFYDSMLKLSWNSRLTKKSYAIRSIPTKEQFHHKCSLAHEDLKPIRKHALAAMLNTWMKRKSCWVQKDWTMTTDLKHNILWL